MCLVFVSHCIVMARFIRNNNAWALIRDVKSANIFRIDCAIATKPPCNYALHILLSSIPLVFHPIGIFRANYPGNYFQSFY